MALAIATITTDSTGKVLTVNISGGTSPILPASNATGFVVRVGSTTLPYASAAAASAHVTITLYDSIRVGDIVVVDYTPGNVVDSAGTPLVLGASTGHAVTNNSTVAALQLNTNIGAHSLIGIGLEPSEGTAVEAQYLLDRTEGSLVMEMATIARGSYRNATSPAGFVAGTTKNAGSITLEATPNTILAILLAVLGDPTAVVLDTKVSGGDPQFYLYTFKDSFGQRTLTISEMQGESTFLNPGCRASGFTCGVGKTQNETVRMALDFMSLNQLFGFAEHELGLDVAGYDASEPWGPTEVQALFNDVVTTSATNVSVKPTKQIGERQVLDGFRGPESHYTEQSAHTSTATLIFTDEENLNLYFGLAANATGKRGATRTVKSQSVAMLIQHDVDQYGKQEFIEFSFPKGTFERVGNPYKGPGVINQDVSIITAQDATEGTSLVVTVGSYLAPATLLTAGTLLTGVPSNTVNKEIS